MTLVNSRPWEHHKNIPNTCLFTPGREGEFKNRQFDASTCSSCRRFLAAPAPTVQPALRCVFPNATPGNRDLRQTHNLSVSVLSCFGVCFFFVISFTQSHNCFFFLCLSPTLSPISSLYPFSTVISIKTPDSHPSANYVHENKNAKTDEI